MQQHSEKYPASIAIVGAGPGGCAAALRLSQLGIACDLYDRASFPRDKVCGDGLSGWTVTLLKRLCPEGLQSIDGHTQAMPSWGVRFSAPDRRILEVPFRDPRQPGTQAPGYVFPRLQFDALLYDACRTSGLIRCIEGTQVKQLHHDAGKGHCLELQSEGQPASRVYYPLVIFANGAYSAEARRLAGIQAERKHYVAGIRAYYEGVRDLHAEGYVELHFVRELLPGYLWIFPLPDGRANVGLGIRSDFISRKKLNLKKLLNELLANDPRFRERFTTARPLTKVEGYGLPLGSRQRQISGDGFLLVGDAASLIDPFTGEGIGNALASGELAANQAARALEAGNFGAAFLQAYDAAVYKKLGRELQLSRIMQELLRFPALFNWLVKKASRNEALRDTLSCMLSSLDVRALLGKPSFYLRLLFNRS